MALITNNWQSSKLDTVSVWHELRPLSGVTPHADPSTSGLACGIKLAYIFYFV